VQFTFAVSVLLVSKYRANGKKAETAKKNSAALACGSELLVLQGKEIWLGGLDSNQDSQIQNLKSCQLDDLPTGLLEDLRSHLILAREQQKRTAAHSRVRDSYDSTPSD
jgi:hypothetical protein